MAGEAAGFLSLTLVLAVAIMYLYSVRSVRRERRRGPRDPFIALYLGDYSGVLEVIRREVKGGGFRARLLLRSIDRAVARGVDEEEFVSLYRRYLRLRGVSNGK